MKDYVSSRWVRVVGLAAPMSMVGAMFVFHGFVWTGLVWLSLGFSGALWAGRASTRSMAQVIDDVEGESEAAVTAGLPLPTTKQSSDRKGDKT